MNYLAIDTSGRNLTIVICKNDKINSYFDSECGINHSIIIMQKIEELCIKYDFSLKDADFFCAVVGAGSFTGIRIGIATIKAMCFAFNKPCLSITSFDTIAYNKDGGKNLSVIDAKHNGFYVCGYQDGQIIYQPNYILKDQLTELAKSYSLLSATEISDIECEIVDIEQGLIKAINTKKDNITKDIESLNPLYVRKSQAEEGR